MPLPSFATLKEDEHYLADIGCGVWLMDDHRWALKVWETERKHDKYTLAHADYHWDGCYDFQDNPEKEAELIRATSGEIAELVKEGEWIRFDSFIAPAVRRGLIQMIHFYCLQDNVGDDALSEEFIASCGARQVIHTDASSFASANIDGPFIFDLCLDLFNRSDKWEEGDLWTDKEITEFLKTVHHLVQGAEIVTISMSFNYSGTAEDTRHLTELVMPQILGAR
jgi:UPF0489 domain